MNNQNNVEDRFSDVTISPSQPTNVLSAITQSNAVISAQSSLRSLAHSTGDYLKAYPAVTLGLTLATGFVIGRVIQQQVGK